MNVFDSREILGDIHNILVGTVTDTFEIFRQNILCKDYRSKVLKTINFSIRSGDFIVIYR